MVLGDGHEYERKSSHRLASRRDGSQFCIPPLLGLCGLCARQGRRAEHHFTAGPCKIDGGNLGGAPIVLIQFAGAAGAARWLLRGCVGRHIRFVKGGSSWGFYNEGALLIARTAM